MKYKLSDDFIVRNIVDECLIVRVSNSYEKDNTFYALNSTGKLIIDGITAEKNFDEIVSDFCDEYDVNFEIAKSDVEEFINEFEKLGVIYKM